MGRRLLGYAVTLRVRVTVEEIVGFRPQGHHAGLNRVLYLPGASLPGVVPFGGRLGVLPARQPELDGREPAQGIPGARPTVVSKRPPGAGGEDVPGAHERLVSHRAIGGQQLSWNVRKRRWRRCCEFGGGV